MSACTLCGHVPKVKRVKVLEVSGPETTAQLFARYHRSAPVEDRAFWLRTRMSEGLRARFLALDPLGHRPAFYRALVSCQDAWRLERHDYGFGVMPVPIEDEPDPDPALETDVDIDPIWIAPEVIYAVNS